MKNMTRREREKRIREEEIVAAAEKVFFQRGFDEASMDEIANEAQFTKSTLYQYFVNKEDLYLAVVLKEFKMLSSYMEDSNDSQTSGYSRLEDASKALYQAYKAKPGIFRILNSLGHVKKKSYDSHRLSEFSKINSGIFQTVASLLDKGKADGSIRKEFDSQKTAFSLVFLLTGFFNQLSVTGASFTENFSLELDDFSISTIGLILGNLRNCDESK